MTSLLTNLFDGVAYGMLLFVLACGSPSRSGDEFRQPGRMARSP